MAHVSDSPPRIVLGYPDVVDMRRVGNDVIGKVVAVGKVPQVCEGRHGYVGAAEVVERQINLSPEDPSPERRVADDIAFMQVEAGDVTYKI